MLNRYLIIIETITMKKDISRLNNVLEEIIKEEELISLLENEQSAKHYIGFEISGKLHIGSGIMTALVIKELQKLGVECNILLADWHTWINDKLGGDMDVIKEVAVGYFKDAITASLLCVEADADKVNFILGSEFYNNNDEYWQSLVDICKNLTLARVNKSSTIMGRAQGENQIFARLLYPPMQVNDIFSIGTHIAHAGMDQRKAHVIAREVATSLKINPLTGSDGQPIKPVALHHHLILGLEKPSKWPIEDDSELRSILSELKMSKSKPNSAVFITDTNEEIRKKIKMAFCPEGEVKFNPILDWAKYLIFKRGKDNFTVQRDEKWGGNLEFNNYEDLEIAFQNKDLHPTDLKEALADEIIELLEPAKKYFSKEDVKQRYNKFLEIYENANSKGLR